jgi:hypothetical protein
MRQFGRNKFQCDETMQTGVLGLIHHTHAPTTKFRQDVVVGNALADKRFRARHSAAVLGMGSRQISEPTA